MQSLEQLFTVNGLLIDKNDDDRPEGLKGFIYIPKGISYEISALAIELASRIGYESVALDYPLTKVYSGAFPTAVKEGSLVLKANKKLTEETAIIELDKGNVYVSASSEMSWRYLRSWLCGLFPNISVAYSLSQLINQIANLSKSVVQISRIKLNTETCNIEEISGNCDQINDLKCIHSPNFIENIIVNGVSIPLDYFESKKPEFQDVVSENMKQITSPNLGNLFNQYYFERKTYTLPEDIVKPAICLNHNPVLEETVALVHLAARFALEGTDFTLPVVQLEKNLMSTQLFLVKVNIIDSCNPYLQLKNNQLVLNGTKSNLQQAAKEFFLNYPRLNENHILQDLTDKLTETLKGVSAAGQFLRVKQAVKESVNPTTAYLSIGPLQQALPFYKQLLAKDNVKLHSAREPREVMNWEYAPQWEVTRALELLTEKLYPKIKQGDIVEFSLLVSEEKVVREKLNSDIESSVEKLGGSVRKATVNRAYKQGMCWLLEEVVPELKRKALVNEVSQVRLGFRPFLPAGQLEWGEEAGATPKLNPQREDNPNRFFDLPIRLLQELYPIDDLLALELPIGRDAIEFYVLKNASDDYLVEFFDADERLLHSSKYSVKYNERPYLDAWPTIGKVHPNTGWVQAKINGQTIIDERLVTDLENIWDYYQQHILNDIQKYIEVGCNNHITADKQPFFRELRLEITASEIDYKLPVRKDLVSTLDALHEDLYFVGLDFFRTLGLRSSGDKLGEPGLILPIIRKTPGEGPRLKATLFAEQQKYTSIISEQVIKQLTPIRHVELNLHKIEFTEAGLDIQYRMEGNVAELEPLLDTALDLAQKGIEVISTELVDKISSISINYRNDDFMNKEWTVSFIDQRLVENEPLSIADVQIPKQVIGIEENERIIKDLARVPELNVYLLQYSYQGRKIYGVEVKPDFQAGVISHAKLLNSKPCFMINSRHHANEVSATNSAYSMIKNLLTTTQGKEFRRDLNIVVIPFENVDGGAVHHQLMQDNPEWKLHVARYNSVGKEIANDYFNEETPYGESRALPKFYCRWLPDAFVDNHGVPSHEWDQQFAGYVAPWFRGFWLPRALFYGYFWLPDGYKTHRDITEKVAEYVARELNQDQEIAEWNNEWRNRFLKYANKWLPKLFPADYRENLIYYWASFNTDSGARHFAPRFPEYTVLDWTTEVSDETAQGEYLEQCSRALTISDFATMKVLTEIPVEYDDQLKIYGNRVYRCHKRVRPIRLSPN